MIYVKFSSWLHFLDVVPCYDVPKMRLETWWACSHELVGLTVHPLCQLVEI